MDLDFPRGLAIGGLAMVMLAAPAAAGRVYFSQPEFVSESAGLLETKVGWDWYRGSGVIARDPKLVFSCAHVFYDRGKWATDYIFYPGWHDRSFPRRWQGIRPRGFHYFTSYAANVKTRGSESNAAFSKDFTVMYGNTGFGPAAPVWHDSGPALRSGLSKRIVGYPSDIDFTGDRGYAYQHSTGWFSYRAFRMRGGYHEFDDVSTGPGNSGGPLFIRDSGSGRGFFGGILVSGGERLAGVVALDLATDTLAGYALGIEDRTLTFSNTRRAAVPAGAGAYLVRRIPVSGFEGTISRITFRMAATTGNRGELEAFLRSPAGKIRWILKRGSSSGANVDIRALDLTSAFSGSAPNGQWQLHLRDAAGGSPAVFENCSVTISAL